LCFSTFTHRNDCFSIFLRIFAKSNNNMTMAKVYVFLANGFEDIEALIPVDVLRRGGVEVVTVSVVEGSRVVETAHRVRIEADKMFAECDFADADVLMLPGGMPGASNLNNHEGVRQALLKQNAAGKRVAAICAAPLVLGGLGLLRGKKATCYPGFEQTLEGATYTGDLCTVDGNVTTGEGPAAAFPFAYSLLSQLKGQQTADQVAVGMRYVHLMEKQF
jgi:4-methyl-5(b-hydroxyethyl)-thiazole monophosphate biosynthesis